MEIRKFPNKLKMFRKSQGYSQKKVARMLGLSDTSSLSRWEHGISYPGIVYIFRLARIYNALPTQLFEHLWLQSNSKINLLSPLDESINLN